MSVSGPCNASNENTVVSQASPTIATIAAPNFVLGAGMLTDNATVSGLASPVAATDFVEFRLYRGADCADANLILTRTDPSLTYNATLTEGAADSGTPFDPPGPGTYRWRAFYSGDVNNNPVSGPCNAPNENTIVGLGAPTIETVASPGFVLGAGQLSDNATVSGLVRPIVGPGEGTVEFRLYGPNDANCVTSILPAPVVVPLVLNATGNGGTAASTAFAPPAAGTYRWRAFYSGDANNLPVAGECNAANESTTVGSPPPPPPPPPRDRRVAAGQGPGCLHPAAGSGARRRLPLRPRRLEDHRQERLRGLAFNVVVSGTEISQVIFSRDGKLVRTLTAPNSGRATC